MSTFLFWAIPLVLFGLLVAVRAHQRANRPQWRRPGVPLSGAPGVLVFGGLCAGFAFFLRGLTGEGFEAIAQLGERPIRGLEDDAGGPGLFHGAVIGPDLETPSGGRGLAFFAWVDRVTRSDDGTNRSRLCTLSHFEGLALRDGLDLVPIEIGGSVKVIRSSTFESPGHNSYFVEWSPRIEQGAVPPPVARRSDCTASSGSLEYSEYFLRSDAEVVVSGCRSQSGIAPCGDGIDFLVACSPNGCSHAQRGVSLMIAYLASGLRWWVFLLSLILGLLLGAIGISHVVAHRRAQRRRLAVNRFEA